MFTRFIYLCLFWFRIVYLHPGFVYLRFPTFVYKFPLCLQTLLCLFTFSNVCIPNFRLVYKYWFVYLYFQYLYTKFSLCLQTLLCLFTFSNVCIPIFRLIYKHRFVYLHFPTFVYRISALFTNTGLFIYIFQCLYTKFPLCLQTLVCLFTSSVFVYFWNVNKRVADSLHDFLKFAFVGW